MSQLIIKAKTFHYFLTLRWLILTPGHHEKWQKVTQEVHISQIQNYHPYIGWRYVWVWDIVNENKTYDRVLCYVRYLKKKAISLLDIKPYLYITHKLSNIKKGLHYRNCSYLQHWNRCKCKTTHLSPITFETKTWCKTNNVSFVKCKKIQQLLSYFITINTSNSEYLYFPVSVG